VHDRSRSLKKERRIDMKKYIGTKIIEAEPAYYVVDEEGKVRIVTEAAEAKRCGTVDLGYKVRYPDGYESFSPKGVFEENAVIVVSVDGGTMTNTAGKTAAVTVSNQTKSKWSRADLLNDGTSATCKVSAELDPGHWTGTATFSCEKTYK